MSADLEASRLRRSPDVALYEACLTIYDRRAVCVGVVVAAVMLGLCLAFLGAAAHALVVALAIFG